MATLTSEGYRMSDGTMIPFHNAKLEDLKVEHIQELNKIPANLWDITLIRVAMHTLRNDVNNSLNSHLLKVEKLLQDNNHVGSCPINKAAVIDIVNKELKDNADIVELVGKIVDASPKRWISSTAAVVKDVLYIGGLAYLILKSIGG